jgi:hypothetical protein
MPRQIEAERVPVPHTAMRGTVCRMHGPGGAPKDNRNALRHEDPRLKEATLPHVDV